MNRRTLIASLFVALTAALAGCSSTTTVRPGALQDDCCCCCCCDTNCEPGCCPECPPDCCSSGSCCDSTTTIK